MQQLSNLSLRELNEHFQDVLALTPRANSFLANLDRAVPMRDDFAKAGFVRLDDILRADALTSLVTFLLPILSPLAGEITMLHKAGSDNTLSDGHHFRRIDPQDIRDPSVRENVTLLFECLGLTEFGHRLGSKLTPLIRYLVGPISYRRLAFLFYDEGDYISAHNDHHMGDRVNAQFPVTFGTVAGLRVLSDGLFRIHYDTAGSMNVLGPRIWHDVPPLLRSASGVAPQRVTLSLRFTPDLDAETLEGRNADRSAGKG